MFGKHWSWWKKKYYFYITSLERGLPLNDKRLPQSFFWLSAENERHMGWRDDDDDDIFFFYFSFPFLFNTSSYQFTLTTRLQSVKRTIQ